MIFDLRFVTEGNLNFDIVSSFGFRISGLLSPLPEDVFAQEVVIAVVLAEHAVRAVRACAHRRPELVPKGRGRETLPIT